jgi:diguanylate cyclase (GGDEF)-like protein
LRLGIRTRVILLVLGSALPLVIAAVHDANEARRAAFERARHEALLLARGLAAAQAGVIDDTRYLLSGFAAQMEAGPRQQLGGRCAVRLGRLLDASPAHRNIAVADLAGSIYCAARPLDRPINVADRPYFRNALAQRSFSLSGSLEARDGGGPLIVAAQPIIDADKAVSGVLIASFRAERLSRLLVDARSPEYVVVNLVDAQGRRIARSPPAPALLGMAVSGFAGHPAADEGFLDLIDAKGIARVSAYTRVPDMPVPMYVVAEIPRERVEALPRAMLRSDLLWLAAVLSVALLLGLLGAHSLVVRPIRRLTEAAKRYRAGDLNARSGLGHGGDEIGRLAGAFDTLAAENQRVNRAFRALSGGNQALIRAKDEPQLLQAACRNAVERAGYRLAFVNYAQHDERKSVRTAAQFGHDEGFVAALELTWADTERGRGTVGTAIREGRTAVIRSVRTDARFALWREMATQHGFGGVASFPLRVEDEVIGTFTLIAAEEGAFDSGELDLLEEMAGDLAFGIATFRSAARRRAAEEAAQHARTHDALTSLPGRVLLTRALEQAMRNARERGEALAAVVVQLQNLQDLHDSLGSDAANTAMMETAARLKFVATPAAHVARLSADEFCLLLPKADPPALQELSARVQSLLEGPVDVKGVPLRMRVAVGASLFPAHGEDAEIVLRRAAIAAREGARRELGFYLYSGATERENPDRLALASELRAAIDARALSLHLQPKVVLRTGEISGAEALARWSHPVRGMVPPMRFVSIAEQTGLIGPMTSLVIELAVGQLAAWRGRAKPVPIAINLSPRNLHDAKLLDGITNALARAGVPPSLLEVEITESALAEDPQHARGVLERLRALGSKIYIDDFGTGYSSLSHLVSLPIDALKIDRSFILQMGRNSQARAVVASIILMARELAVGTVAEGVETQQDVDLLRELGCEQAQGYFYGRPVPPEAFTA